MMGTIEVRLNLPGFDLDAQEVSERIHIFLHDQKDFSVGKEIREV